MALNSDDETKQHIFNRCLTVSVKTDGKTRARTKTFIERGVLLPKEGNYHLKVSGRRIKMRINSHLPM